MPEAAEQIFANLNRYSRIRELIDDGEAEGVYLECKAPHVPRLSRDLKAKLAQAISGFANTAGGVIIWGVSTTKHAESGLDILTQIEPIASCKRFAQQIDRAIPTLTTPPIQTGASRVLHRRKTDTRGVVVTYIPQTTGDPVRSTIDRRWYLRSGDQFIEMPYQVLQRMFAATSSPDLHFVFHHELVSLGEGEAWKLPIAIENRSSAVAEHVLVSVEITSPSACEKIQAEQFRDVSHLNPGKSIYMVNYQGVIHRGLNEVVGRLKVSMRKGKRLRRVLRLIITIYAGRMRARRWNVRVQLAKKGFSVKAAEMEFLY